MSTTNLEKPIIVSATIRHALGDLFNLFLLLGMLSFIVTGTRRLVLTGYDGGTLFAVFAVSLFMILFVWAVINRSVQVDREGIRYITGFKRGEISWKELDGVRIEPRYKQVIFWVQDKRVRLNFSGMPREDTLLIYKVLIERVEAGKLQAR